MSLIKSTATIGSLTLASRILGFIRDVLIANTIGASWLSDAFFVAFKLPNFFRRLFAEGAFNAAFVPQFAGLLTKEGKNTALQFASESLSVLLVALLMLNAVFLLFMPWLLQWFAPGFVGQPDKYTLAVELSRIAFPYILFISLVSLLGGILNSIGRFAAVAGAPIILNICLIGGLLVLPEHVPTAAHALSLAVFIAGILQLMWVWFACFKYQALPGLVLPRLTSHVRKLLRLIAPAALGAGVAQINLLIDVILASTFEEGVSYLYYADRLNELPIGVIGVAVGTALLPTLSKQIREAKIHEAHHSLNRAMELVLCFGVPACFALLLIPEPIISVMYQHGAFTSDDTLATYTALMAYAVGLPAFVMVKVLAPGFYANEDTKTPFAIAGVCVLVNLGFNLLLMHYYEHVGLAMATSISGWLNAILMALILYKRKLLVPDRTFYVRLMKIIVAAIAMGIVIVLVYSLLSKWFTGSQTQQIIALVVLIGTGKLVYGGMLLALKFAETRQLRSYFKRR